jgi:hypothetical protein
MCLPWQNVFIFIYSDAYHEFFFASSGVKTHLYCFGTEQHENDNPRSFVSADQGGPSLLDTIILSQVL